MNVLGIFKFVVVEMFSSLILKVSCKALKYNMVLRLFFGLTSVSSPLTGKLKVQFSYCLYIGRGQNTAGKVSP